MGLSTVVIYYHQENLTDYAYTMECIHNTRKIFNVCKQVDDAISKGPTNHFFIQDFT